MAPLRILHAHSTFTLGGKEARAVRLMNAFGDRASHVILSAMPGALAARGAIDPAIRVAFPDDAPSLIGKPSIGRYRQLSRYMRQFDLVLTYNWGSMDVVGARRLFGGPPLIHHEDGFNEDEVVRQNPKRIWFRRLMLPAARQVIIPSRRLETIARTIWWQPEARVTRISNGIALPSEAEIADPRPIAGLGREGLAHEGLVIGTVAGLRPVKNLPRLVRAFAAGAPADARLVILGEGPEEAAIRAESERCGVADRLIMPGFVRNPATTMGAFDIFALSSDSEQFPISLVEAMACGLPAIATDVGDIRSMVSDENQTFIVDVGDEGQLAAVIAGLAQSLPSRRSIGAANRVKALQEYDERAMIERYRDVYSRAVGRPGSLG